MRNFILSFLIVIPLFAQSDDDNVRYKMKQLEHSLEEAWTKVENNYNNRYKLTGDMITFLNQSPYKKKIKKEIVNLINKRGDILKAESSSIILNSKKLFDAFQIAQRNLSNALSKLFIAVERYSELKANENFLQLQAQLEGTENRISVERMKYNQDAMEYNSYLIKYYDIAAKYNFKEKQHFENNAEGIPPKIEF